MPEAKPNPLPAPGTPGAASSAATEAAALAGEWRHAIHRHPELSGEEFGTRSFVVDKLREMGYEPRTFDGHAGVTALHPGRDPSRCVVLRADMDALPLDETSGKEWSSQKPGIMHACGHDGHTALLLGVARALREEKRSYPWSVLLLFQPAEENGEGAKHLLDDGALDEPRALAVFGLHGWPDLEPGCVAVHRQAVMASVDNFEIRIRGRGGHGAMPHQTRDPLVTAAHIITAAQTLVSRRTAPLESSVLTFGRIQGGKTHNVIPASCTLWGTVRTLDAGLRQAMRTGLEGLCRHLGEALETPVEVEWQETCPATVNDPAMADLARAAAEKALGADKVRDIPPSMGGEDFSYFLERFPGAYFWLGLGDGQGPLHNPRFDFNDASLETGIRVFLGVLDEAALRIP